MKMAEPLRRIVIVCLIVTGISEGFVQVIVLRELLAGFYGTELLTGIALGGWMLLNSLGCLLSAKIFVNVSLKSLLWIQAIVGLTAFLTCSGILAGCSYLASNIHSQINWLSYAVLALLILLPFCVLSGIQYIVGLRILAGITGYSELKSSSDSYVYNSAGMLAGFLIATFFLISRFNSVRSALLIMGLNCFAVVFISLILPGAKRTTALIFLSGLIIYAGIFASGVPERVFQSSVALRAPLEQIEKTADTNYSRLVVTSSHNQYNFYLNGCVEGVFPDFDPTIEKKVHFALLMHPNPERVFVMGGLTAGVLDELLKHQPLEVDYGEIDPDYLAVALEYMQNSSKSKYNKVQFINSDVRSYLQEVKGLYDVIIVIPPPPATLSANRYYTTEFFRVAGNALRKGGLFCTGLSSSDTYAGNGMKRLNYSVFKALGAVFPSAVIIPGEEGVIISGNTVFDGSALKEMMARRYKDRKIEANLVTPEYIELMLDPQRLKDARGNFIYEGPSVTNNDYFPASMQYYSIILSERENVVGYQILNWFSLQPTTRLFLIFLLLGMIPLMIKIAGLGPAKNKAEKPLLSYMIFISGMAGFSGFIILVYLFQVKSGSLYGDIGIISAANLGGYALGAGMAGKFGKVSGKIVITVFVCMLTVLIFVLLSASIPIILTKKISFIVLILLWGILNGAVYPLLSKYASALGQNKIKDFAGLYVFELTGAACGAVLTGVLLLGAIGVTYTVLLIIAALAFNMLQLFLATQERDACFKIV